MRRAFLVLVGVLALDACTFTGPKSGNPGWKIFKEEHDRPVPPDPVRVGSTELRVTRVYLRREYTAVKTVNWTAWIRATVTSSEPLPLASLDGRFKVTTRSGKVYDAHTSTAGPGRATWQHQEHTGQPTHLPANVPGEIDIWISFDSNSKAPPDELGALRFGDAQVSL